MAGDFDRARAIDLAAAIAAFNARRDHGNGYRGVGPAITDTDRTANIANCRELRDTIRIPAGPGQPFPRWRMPDGGDVAWFTDALVAWQKAG